VVDIIFLFITQFDEETYFLGLLWNQGHGNALLSKFCQLPGNTQCIPFDEIFENTVDDNDDTNSELENFTSIEDNNFI
jgi:hypothetical protein